MFSNTVILVGEPKRFCGDIRLVNTQLAIADQASDTWSDLVDPASTSTPMPFLLRVKGSVWAMLERAPMGASRTTFGISQESLATVSNEGLGILHSIQKALWTVYYGYADHTTIHGWGSVICFRAPGQHFDAQSGWVSPLWHVKSTLNMSDRHVLSLDAEQMQLVAKALRLRLYDMREDASPDYIRRTKDEWETLRLILKSLTGGT